MSHSQFFLLRTNRFLPLFLTQFMGAFNDNIFKNALIILITYHAAGKVGIDPRLMVTAAAGIFILPFFLFSATAGQIADKFEKAKLIRIIRFLEMPVMMLAAVGFFLENYWMLLAVLFCAGTQSAFFGPLKYSILPGHLKEKELIGGNALIEAGTFLAILLGTILGGILILKEGGITFISVILIVISFFGWLSSRWIPVAKPENPDLKVGYNIIAETWKLVRHTFGEKDVFLSIIGISWFWLTGFTFLAQFPIYVRDIVGGNEEIVTLFLTVFSIGIAIGSLVCSRLLKGEVSGIYVPFGAFGMTAGIFLFWLASPSALTHEEFIGFSQFIGMGQSWLILSSLLSIAVFGGIYIVPLYAIMQTRCEVEHRSRTIAINNVINALFMVIGAVITMVLLKLDVNITEIFLIMGIANIPVAFLVRRIVKIRRAARGEKS